MTGGRRPLSSRPRGTARGGVPDDELRAAWTRWLGVLRTHGWDPAPVLRSGAAPTAIAAAEGIVGYALPDPLRALFALTDGQADPAVVGGPVLFPARTFCSLTDAVQRWRGRDEGGWPLAAGADGGLLLVDEEGRIVGPSGVLADGIVDYLARLSVAELEGPASPADGAVVWDAPGLR